MNVRLDIEYNGKQFQGWQKQPNKLNIQGYIEKAIKEIIGEEVNLIGAGRTDAGVHALNQVANFHTKLHPDLNKLKVGLNSKLKNRIIITNISEVDEEFHSRYSAKSRTYRYIFNNSSVPSCFSDDYEYYIYKDLDVNAMEKAVKYFVGIHDFASFKSSGTSSKSSIREIIKAEIKEVVDNNVKYENKRIYLEINATGFMYNMMRIIAGTLLDVGLHKIEPEVVKEIIEAKDRKKAGKTLPAKGLCLLEVTY